MASSLASAAPNEASLDGLWGGDRLQLTLKAGTGGRLETDCASGSLDGPLLLASDGSFVAAGRFEQHRPGPATADAAMAPAAARYRAEVDSDGLGMTLTIQSAATAAPQIFNLRKGAKIKLIRCL